MRNTWVKHILLKQDGHVLWTFGCSERIPGADTDYGLFNQNLIDFEKDGRIVIKKLQETFKVKRELDTF